MDATSAVERYDTLPAPLITEGPVPLLSELCMCCEFECCECKLSSLSFEDTAPTPACWSFLSYLTSRRTFATPGDVGERSGSSPSIISAFLPFMLVAFDRLNTFCASGVDAPGLLGSRTYMLMASSETSRD
jgi:hypothetical protein